MRIKLAAMLLACGLAGAAGAETEVDAYGLGPHKPNPEEWIKLDDAVSLRVRIVHDKSGELAPTITRAEVLRLEVAFTAANGAKDRPLRFHCKVKFVSPEAEWSDWKADQPCFEGRLAQGLGTFVPLDLDFRFRPKASDPRGTSGVSVQFTEEIANDHLTLTPTFRWEDDSE
ncbi:hypothetical protein [Rhodobacter ferrooxidans]|uniref:Uncharacterized protein n=1 Tax=Rhodobacter ferrooxidans TaxID=371731 RepID=C8S574_9RHOB|nr:hypothetical protein [Rhodobacter sp. SW2]EEW23870.1 hypothetical protein Rsw2DRAFT_3202 [Rhodobacter sp. SW2]